MKSALETVHTVVSIFGPAITLLGVIVSVVGTYLMTKWYHPFAEEGFQRHLIEDAPELAMIMLTHSSTNRPAEGNGGTSYRTGDGLTREQQKKLARLEKMVELGRVNEERRSVTLVGIDLLFMGFVLQGAGALASLIDLAWNHI